MFNSESTVRACIGSIPKNCEVLIVDQQSGDDSVPIAQSVRPDARVIRAGANRGFGAGCNLGAANASGDVLIFLNPDAFFLWPESVDILSESARSRNALVGPRIFDLTGVEQTRARYWSTVSSELGEVFLPGELAKGIFRREVPLDCEVYRVGGRVPYVQGSCMAISAENFWRVNGFDERLFLYREEETLSLSLQKIGVETRLESQAAISHIGGNSTGQYPEFSATQYYRSEAIFLLLRYSKPVATTAIAALWVTLNAMAALTPIRRIVGPRSANGYRWYRAAAAGAISGWRREIVDPPRVSSAVATSTKGCVAD